MITYRLYGPTPEEAARVLGQTGAQARREAKRAFHRDMRAEMGLEPLEALGK